MLSRLTFAPVVSALTVFTLSLTAADWPMWRHDAGRTAESQQKLPEAHALLWQRQLPELTPAYHDVRLHFDRGYEPVVKGQRMFVASNGDDSVTAFDTRSGDQVWKYFTEGPIRFAPVAWENSVLFGSDDGNFYSLNATDGSLRWKFKAVPSDRKLIGNRRLISVWPVRGGPVVKDNNVYFAAGVWPFEGVFVYALEAETGKVVWLNDHTGFMYGQQPHNAQALAGLAPQGYLLIEGEDLIVPSSSAYPARFDLKTGKLKEFQLPAAGRLPGGWFASLPGDFFKNRDPNRKGLLADLGINAVRHEDKPRTAGSPEIRTTIRAANREFRFTNGFPNVTGTIHTMLAADDRLFVTTEDGNLYCFGERASKIKTQKHQHRPEPLRKGSSYSATAVLKSTGAKRGYAVMLGGADLPCLESMVAETHLQVTVVENSAKHVSAIRKRFDAAGLYGRRISVTQQRPGEFEMPPYFANLIVVGDGVTLSKIQFRRIYKSVRPYGGHLVIPASARSVAQSAELPGARFYPNEAGFVMITRDGALRGATNYEGEWGTSPDDLVRAPLGVLWFDDTIGLFKRAPQPKIVDGVMVTVDKEWLDASTRKGKQDYRLTEPEFSDVYTGRVFEKDEAYLQRQRFSEVDREKIQPSQYRPPKQKDDWKPEKPDAGLRRNPLTGEKEPRTFPKSYGCDGGFDYGNLYTMRSGTAAFYDKRSESGTINISGPRSGCSNSVIPANGVLNVPYFYKGCTCSYPLPTGLSMISLPQTHEQWTAWGDIPMDKLAGKIERIGINLGAPGDRMTDDGTLWIDYPASGGPSPQVKVTTVPAKPETYYRHSLWIEGGTGWPWVGASGAKNLESLTVHGMKPGKYQVRLVFAEPDDSKSGKRVFDVKLNDQTVLKSFDLAKEANGRMRVVTRSFPVEPNGDTITVKLAAIKGNPILSGVEIISDGLKSDEPIRLTK